jgi:fermentation-respiration switch protein FrsA (DUF1100 family)
MSRSRIGWLGLAGLPAAAMAGLTGMACYSAERLIERRQPDATADPAALGLEYEPVQFPSQDGLRLGGWFIPGKAPVRGTVIFCHGHAGSLDPDLQYVPVLQQHGYHVLQFDFRAHGRSQGQYVSMGYWERLDLLGAVEFLQMRDIRRVGVLGFSMGGAVAISTAARCPAIAAVVSDGGFARIVPTVRAGMHARGLPGWMAGPLAPAVVWIAGRRLGCTLPSADPLHWIKGISPRPVLLIHGGRDPFVPAAEIEALYRAAGHPKTLSVVPEAGHRQVHEVRPQEYVDQILSFFDHGLSGEAPDV